MTGIKFYPTVNRVFRHRLRVGPARNLGVFWLLLIAWLLLACTTLPDPGIKTLTLAYEPHPDSRLAIVSRDLIADTGIGESGFFKLFRNDDAMRWRLLLADTAEETLDMQYFIWKGDASGELLLDRVIKAADRGVRVRILVDDIYLLGADRTIAALSQHPQIEMRMFNPAQRRTNSIIVRGLEMLGNIEQLNQRMHNKLIVADNRFAIVGGRNLGNEYFGLNPKQNFTDFDVLAFGRVAKKVSASFDIYWNNQWAYPGEALLQNYKGQELLPLLLDELQDQLDKNRKLLVEFKQHNRNWDSLLLELKVLMKDGTSRVIYDEPLIGEKIPPTQLIESLDELTDDTRYELLISTPYFIPDDDFYLPVSDLISDGVRVVVLTNSLASTNHPIVHSGYKKHRKKLIETGVALFELRHDASARGKFDTPPVKSKAFGLHAKYIVIDRQFTFVGSLNLDPRSIYINTEMGLIIDSPNLAAGVVAEFEEELKPENSWQVLLDEKGLLFWKAGDKILRREPARSFWQRFQSSFFGMFELDDQL
ncbi:Cardiolipin synthase (EC phosphatidylethanolamine-utilizing, bacterial type ClsC [Olavius sp. associated proteobacterium Delta 1]|nr:Cardiolipin synthase (EC phosphatidylethanolamine-utilizing, bacterial type ClsC [Olavius sp. associated proteobacterium Delta 1]